MNLSCLESSSTWSRTLWPRCLFPHRTISLLTLLNLNWLMNAHTHRCFLKRILIHTANGTIALSCFTWAWTPFASWPRRTIVHIARLLTNWWRHVTVAFVHNILVVKNTINISSFNSTTACSRTVWPGRCLPFVTLVATFYVSWVGFHIATVLCVY